MSSKSRFDAAMMRRALRLARLGVPSPNPHVGAVIVQAGEVVGEGYHRKAGEAHAEINALREAGPKARGSTLYVTFEPCNHTGRTPPCTDAIIAAGIARVVIGCRDPAPHVTGGMDKLEQAGIALEVGVCRQAAEALVADFIKHHTQGIPYVTLKAAVTLDGHIATQDGHSQWITGEAARTVVHDLRAQSDAVLVGIGTVLADNPMLTVRHVEGPQPLRVVLDSHLRTPHDAHVLKDHGGAATLIFCAEGASAREQDALRAKGAEVHAVPQDIYGRLHWKEIMRHLGKRDVVRLLVEGGATVHGSLIEDKLVDELMIFVAPTILGSHSGLNMARTTRKIALSEAYRWRLTRVRRLGNDVLIRALNVEERPCSPA